ncbi:RHS repeat-associated core domain-containing protein [Herbivorax sp. ANBcel31]|uniref:RHS repeat-associated core domain-containing protein n=1 Tax=Herbivorax sp. ANBcel31 TaxID=3069754 RepID=UPI0027B229E4|nr:RHS repeat-associated core domain-containing protein [Herbivorax sp. ANBcel31]MDQ2087851.1 RHS repeat-associated core domain-containing protein [Herbivorax sp. ANBcel31]
MTLLEITTRVDGGVTETTVYDYDDNGNQLTLTRNGEVVTTNRYNEKNQLVETNTKGRTVVNIYNGEGLRVAKEVDGSLTRYLYENLNVVLETDANGNQTAGNLYGLNLLMRDVDGESYYYMYNGHADVTALIKTTIGEIAATYYYDAFGNILESTGDVDNNITYAGYQWDEETGLYYLNARMYDPKIARFLQEDTCRGDPNDPLSSNLYKYCHDEPIMYFDPTGHSRQYKLQLRSAAEDYAANAVDWDSDSKMATITIGGVKKDYYIRAGGKVYVYGGKQVGVLNDENNIMVNKGYFYNAFDISSNTFSYIFYDSTDKHAKNVANKRKKGFDHTHDFEDGWNEMEGKIKQVIIVAHGTPETIEFGRHNEDSKSYLVIKDGVSEATRKISGTDDVEISELETKIIDTLTLISCNTGHLCHKRNIATEFLTEHTISKVFAYDGNVASYPIFHFTYIGFWSHQQREFNDYLSKNRMMCPFESEPRGKIEYLKSENTFINEAEFTAGNVRYVNDGGFFID